MKGFNPSNKHGAQMTNNRTSFQYNPYQNPNLFDPKERKRKGWRE